jgi:glycosyltransferase involved in cell wall biosynthesis
MRQYFLAVRKRLEAKLAMKKPLLTVCLITYNHAQYIRQGLDTVLMQEVDFPWRVVIADDCSTDGTREILQEYKDKFPDLIQLALQEKNVGPERNWLDLLACAKSKYVLYGEGDDYFTDPTKLQRQVDFLEAHEDYTLCFHPVRVTYEDSSRSDEIFPSAEARANKTSMHFDDLLQKNFMQTNSVMYRWRFEDEDIKQVFPRGIVPGDWYLHLLHAKKGRIGYLDKVMSVYRRHPSGLWWDADNDVSRIWRKYGIPHLRLYAEMIKLDESNTPSVIVVSNIRVAFEGLATIDSHGKEGLLKAAILAVPEAAEALIQTDIDVINKLTKQSIDQTDRLNELQYKLNEVERLRGVQQDELRSIKASRVWRFRNKLARVIGKKPI